MGIFDRFPYSSTHEMNLDFMLGKATEIAESLQEIDTHKEQAEQAATNAAQSATNATQAAQAAAGSQTAAGTSASQAAQHKADAEDAADRAEAASNLADEAVEQAQTAAQTAGTAAQNASTAADGAIASAAAAETRINNLAASLPEDFTELNNKVTDLQSAINTETDVIALDDPVNIPFKIAGTSALIQAQTGEVIENSAYSAYSYTDYIDVSSFKTITYKRIGITGSSVVHGMAFYKDDYSYDSGYKSVAGQASAGYVSTPLTVNVPSMAKYARFTVYTDTSTYGNFAITGNSKLFNNINGAIKTKYPYLTSSDNANNIIDPSVYLAASAQNMPTTGTYLLITMCASTSATDNSKWIVQFAVDDSSNSLMYKRFAYYNGSTWSFKAWKKVLDESNEPFAGKKVACFGDSITELGDYPSRFATKTGATVYKCGFGGCRMSTYGNDPYSTMCMSYLSDYIADNDYTNLITGAQSVYEQYGDDNRTQAQLVSEIDYSALDYMIIFFGTNDYSGNIPIGQDTDEGHDTFKGAINLIVKNILTEHPNIHLMFITPFWRATYTGTSDFCDSDTYTNPLGFKLPDYVDALISRANALHVPVLNLYDSMCIGKYNYTKWLADGLHPKSGKGYEYIAQKILAGFEKFYHS